MKPDELWIGDWLKSKITGRTGRYEGMDAKGRLRVNIDGSIVLMKSVNAELTTEPSLPKNVTKDLIEDNSIIFHKNFSPSNTVIDLHIEVLNPDLLGSEPIEIRDFQMAACRKFVENTYEKGRKEVKIIHGKGEGKLRAYIQQMLRSDPRVNFISENPDGGSTVVLFKV